jgi:hypothetical protein
VVALSEAQGFPSGSASTRALHAATRVMAGDVGALLEIMDGMALAARREARRGASLCASGRSTRAPPASSPSRRTRSRPVWPSPQTASPTPTSTARRRPPLATGGPPTGRRPLSPRHHHRPRAGRPLAGAARRDEPRPPGAIIRAPKPRPPAPRSTRRSPKASHARPHRREGAARRFGVGGGCHHPSVKWSISANPGLMRSDDSR